MQKLLFSPLPPSSYTYILHPPQGDPGVEGLAGEKGEKVKSLQRLNCSGFNIFEI